MLQKHPTRSRYICYPLHRDTPTAASPSVSYPLLLPSDAALPCFTLRDILVSTGTVCRIQPGGIAAFTCHRGTAIRMAVPCPNTTWEAAPHLLSYRHLTQGRCAALPFAAPLSALIPFYSIHSQRHASFHPFPPPCQPAPSTHPQCQPIQSTPFLSHPLTTSTSLFHALCRAHFDRIDAGGTRAASNGLFGDTPLLER